MAAYFKQIDEFIDATLGKEARQKYQIIIDNPLKEATSMQKGGKVTNLDAHGDAYYFNWLPKIDEELQHPFDPTRKYGEPFVEQDLTSACC